MSRFSLRLRCADTRHVSQPATNPHPGWGGGPCCSLPKPRGPPDCAGGPSSCQQGGLADAGLLAPWKAPGGPASPVSSEVGAQALPEASEWPGWGWLCPRLPWGSGEHRGSGSRTVTAALGGTEQRGGRASVPRDMAAPPDFMFGAPGIVFLLEESGTVTQQGDTEGAPRALSALPGLFPL